MSCRRELLSASACSCGAGTTAAAPPPPVGSPPLLPLPPQLRSEQVLRPEALKQAPRRALAAQA